MNIVRLHQLIDQWAAEERLAEEAANQQATPVPVGEPTGAPGVGDIAFNPVVDSAIPSEPKKTFFNDKNQRVVRTKTSGDRVFLLDENTKKRFWLTTPAIVTAHGFDMATDVQEIDDSELMKYTMGPAIHRLPNEENKVN